MLHETLSASYNDLVTRSTGAAVRRSIEQAIPVQPEACAVLDFSDIGLVDHSCADEVVARLVLDRLHASGDTSTCPVIFRGLTEAHCEAIEPVLDRHGLVIVAEMGTGELVLLGPVTSELRGAFDRVISSAKTSPVASTAAENLECEVQALLERHVLPPQGWRGTSE